MRSTTESPNPRWVHLAGLAQVTPMAGLLPCRSATTVRHHGNGSHGDGEHIGEQSLIDAQDHFSVPSLSVIELPRGYQAESEISSTGTATEQKMIPRVTGSFGSMSGFVVVIEEDTDPK